MAVKIKLQRLGKIRTPHYRVVIADARTKRDGKVIENIGIYEPKAEPSVIKINSERAQHWLSVGAQPTEAVAALLKVTGDWQKFKGIEGAEGTLRVAEPKPSKLELFNQALSEANNGPTAEAITEKKKKAREDKEAKEAAEKAAAEKAAAAEAAAESEEAPAEEAAAEEA
ncbi:MULTISPECIES: 30S ribosomal protein S16 [Corynebacterium]|jgi:small subunit ribosomal protein S16|uniref:Small ribosomal subunit protein bS16 n=2 Tax=Corynebacterium TaxID=1716 RepID=A0A0F6Z5T5_9CORY|nr:MULTISPECIES: 30S ribosomal protein S16 [Corynebacterium]AGN19562.1 30S ribosomal protein S16 [Corynebacterium glutamicum SCgG1]AGN22587.1 30S ribosomal protein S16 [Corynebacterium glutamicum SCgG2]AKF27846.1 30S ribosomal protein S16 [[Brevibacterium] flavum]ALP50508.1 30S ribosomal protein S16 [Corynebacterium glutamicum]AMA00524.1 30S ribosomal protein S16 [Corynebacterium glutamicum]